VVTVNIMNEMVRGKISGSTGADVVSRQSDHQTPGQDPGHRGTTTATPGVLSVGHRAEAGLGHILGAGHRLTGLGADHPRHTPRVGQTPKPDHSDVALGDVDTRRTSEAHAIARPVAATPDGLCDRTHIQPGILTPGHTSGRDTGQQRSRQAGLGQDSP